MLEETGVYRFHSGEHDFIGKKTEIFMISSPKLTLLASTTVRKANMLNFLVPTVKCISKKLLGPQRSTKESTYKEKDVS